MILKNGEKIYYCLYYCTKIYPLVGNKAIFNHRMVTMTKKQPKKKKKEKKRWIRTKPVHVKASAALAWDQDRGVAQWGIWVETGLGANLASGGTS